MLSWKWSVVSMSCLLSLICAVQAAGPGDMQAVIQSVKAGSVVSGEDAGQVWLCNAKVGLLVEKSSGKLIGVWNAAGLRLVDNTLALGRAWMPLWSAQVLAKGADKPVLTDGAVAKPAITLEASDDGSRQMVMTWTDVPAGDLKLAATLRIALRPDDGLATWRMDAAVSDGEGGVFSITYPQLAVVGSDPQPESNWKIIPYRRGTIGMFARDVVRYDTQQPYPGPAAKFQFMATYGLNTGAGVYMGAHDGEACNKVFIQRNYQDRNAMLLAIEHWPNGRAVPGARWSAPYDVAAGGYQGDWYDACRLYRSWWRTTVWASKGLLQDRSDIPDWVKRAAAVTRPSTTKAARTVAANLKGYEALLAAVPQRPIFGVWYGVYTNLTGKDDLDSEGHGQLRPLKEGVADALALLRQKDVHHIAYVQSLIYDPAAADEADLALAMKNVGRGSDGNPFYYGPPRLAMCRATPWWQQRIEDIAAATVRAGFEGVYLDSFGKGYGECLDPSHGHSLGGGNTVIASQRQMAQRAIDAMRKVNPEAILSGEAPVEAFRDLLHVNLYAKNTWQGYVPAFRAIWGDYSLGFGRVIRPAKDGPGNIIPELGVLFVEGAVMGRLFTEGGSFVLADPDLGDALAYLNLTNDYSLAGIDFLRYGDMLHPLKLDVPDVEFLESVENGKTRTPAVLHSVSRSHRDGSVAVVLTNIGTQALTVEVPMDPSWRSAGGKEATLYRMDHSGARTRLASGSSPWRQSVTLPPADVAFLILQ